MDFHLVLCNETYKQFQTIKIYLKSYWSDMASNSTNKELTKP